jgi:hypothetical protein
LFAAHEGGAFESQGMALAAFEHCWPIMRSSPEPVNPAKTSSCRVAKASGGGPTVKAQSNLVEGDLYRPAYQNSAKNMRGMCDAGGDLKFSTVKHDLIPSLRPGSLAGRRVGFSLMALATPTMLVALNRMCAYATGTCPEVP